MQKEEDNYCIFNLSHKTHKKKYENYDMSYWGLLLNNKKFIKSPQSCMEKKISQKR